MVRVYTPEGLQRLRESAAAIRAARAVKTERRAEALRALDSVAGATDRDGSTYEILSLFLLSRLNLLSPKQQRRYAEFVHVFGPDHNPPVLNRAVAALREREAPRDDQPVGG